MTVIKSGSPGANKLYNAALFTESTRRLSFTNMLTGSAPKSPSKNKMDGRKQTEAGAPFVRITDLSKAAGDEVTVDLFHQLRGKPTMGDRKIAGRGEKLTSSHFNVKINQGRHQVESGGRMTRKRTKHNIMALAKTMLGPYFNRFDDQVTHCHLAGARGDHIDADWIVPLESDEEFAEEMINPITPPTYDRHMFGGDAASFEAIDSADLFGLPAVDNIRLAMDEMAYPIQPIKFEKDPHAEESPFYVLGVSPRQWHDFWTGADGATIRTLQAAVHKRASDFNHPIFKGECVMWNNILIRKMTRPIRFNTGSTVNICTNTNDAQVTQATAGTRIERASLLGAQALACAYGQAGEKSKGGYYFDMFSEATDAGNANEHTIAWMNGKKKFQFKGSDGRVNDHGVMTLDTAVSG